AAGRLVVGRDGQGAGRRRGALRDLRQFGGLEQLDGGRGQVLQRRGRERDLRYVTPPVPARDHAHVLRRRIEDPRDRRVGASPAGEGTEPDDAEGARPRVWVTLAATRGLAGPAAPDRPALQRPARDIRPGLAAPEPDDV